MTVAELRSGAVTVPTTAECTSVAALLRREEAAGPHSIGRDSVRRGARAVPAVRVRRRSRTVGLTTGAVLVAASVVGGAVMLSESSTPAGSPASPSPGSLLGRLPAGGIGPVGTGPVGAAQVAAAGPDALSEPAVAPAAMLATDLGLARSDPHGSGLPGPGLAGTTSAPAAGGDSSGVGGKPAGGLSPGLPLGALPVPIGPGDDGGAGTGRGGAGPTPVVSGLVGKASGVVDRLLSVHT